MHESRVVVQSTDVDILLISYHLPYLLVLLQSYCLAADPTLLLVFVYQMLKSKTANRSGSLQLLLPTDRNVAVVRALTCSQTRALSIDLNVIQ